MGSEQLTESLWGISRAMREKPHLTSYNFMRNRLDKSLSLRHLFSGNPGRPVDEKGDRLERLIALLRGLDAGDLEVFNEILPRLVEWKGDNVTPVMFGFQMGIALHPKPKRVGSLVGKTIICRVN